MIFKLTYRTQLITALNAKPQRSNSNIRRTLSQATKPLRKTLKKSDYPNVKHWERRQNDAVQFAVIKVYDSDFSDSDSDSNEGITKRESGVLAFLEDKNGKVIDRHERKRLYSELRGFWNDNIDSNCPPDNWSSAGATLRDKFRDVLEEKFPFLCLCTGRWKVEALWKKNYHSWKRSLLARQARKTPLVTGSSDKGGKRKRKESLEPANSLDKTEVSLDHDAPQPKKAKTGMASIESIPIAGPSQLVCQLIDNARLSFTAGATTNNFFSTQFD
jgi:hypothetical protein